MSSKCAQDKIVLQPADVGREPTGYRTACLSADDLQRVPQVAIPDWRCHL